MPTIYYIYHMIKNKKKIFFIYIDYINLEEKKYAYFCKHKIILFISIKFINYLN